MAITVPTPVYGGLVAVIYAVYAHFRFFGLTTPLPWSEPKRPLLLHEFLLPQLLVHAALCVPLDRTFVAAVALPPIAASFWSLLGTGARSSATGYAIGTAVAFMGLKALELLVFRDIRTSFRRYDRCGGERHRTRSSPHDNDSEGYPETLGDRLTWTLDAMNNLRGPGWSWCVPLPLERLAGSRGKWLLKRAARGAVMMLWLDLLVYYVRTLDREFFVPPASGGAPYPGLFAPTTKPPMAYPAPLGFPAMPEDDGWTKSAYGVVLHTLRTLLSASAMYTTISGMYTAVGILSVLAGAVLGLPYPLPAGFAARWLSPEAWPDAFGNWLDGDFGGGIRGWWGRGWHGLFRSVFTAPASWIVDRLGLARAGVAATIVNSTVPFAASALLHFLGCWTQSFGGFGAARFFLVQPVGILLETAAAQLWRRCGGNAPAIEKALPYLWTVFWLCATSSSFFEDYRWGGVWTVEPIPVSIIRSRADLWITSKPESGWLFRWARTAEEGGALGRWGVLIGGGGGGVDNQ